MKMNAQFEAINSALEQQVSQAKLAENFANSQIDACKSTLTQSIESTRKDLTLELKESLSVLENRTVDHSMLSQVFTRIAQEVTSTNS